MSRLTENEVKSLQAIVSSEYQDGRDPVDHDVWTQYVNPFKSKKTQSGVYASLSKKGFIVVGFLENGDGKDRMGTVNITQKGYDALQAANKASDYNPTGAAKAATKGKKSNGKLDARIIRNAKWFARYVKKHGGDVTKAIKLFTDAAVSASQK